MFVLKFADKSGGVGDSDRSPWRVRSCRTDYSVTGRFMGRSAGALHLIQSGGIALSQQCVRCNRNYALEIIR